MYKIYKLLDPITKEIRYIGKTKQSLKARLNSHVVSAFDKKRVDYNCYRSCWIRKTVNKYNVFPIIEQITSCITSEESNKLEIYYISLYKRKCDGGILTNTDDGTNSFSYYRELVKTDKIELGKAVRQFDFKGNLVKEWNKITDVENHLGISNSHISSCCRGKKNSIGGFIWRYKEDEFDKYFVKQTERRRICKYDKKGNLIKIYKSPKEILKDFPNLKSSSNITSVCKGRQHSFGGFIFRYKNDAFNKFPITKKLKSLYLYDLNNTLLKEFNGYEEASNFLGVCFMTLKRHIDKDSLISTKYRLRFNKI